jgi:lipopolysaccharide biosynthesis glycosyltransferase
MRKAVFIGFEPREQDAFAIAVTSLQRHATEPVEIMAVDLSVLQQRGLYQRPLERRDGRLFDVISDAPMSTEFAISRFFVPLLATEYCDKPWDLAVFMDCDVMLRADIGELFALADPAKALQCVQHKQEGGAAIKMDGQTQTFYARKNWSSVMMFNLRHPAHRTLTTLKLNTWTGRALHGFNWLSDEFIGALPAGWNHLVGVDQPDPEAKLVHYTLGIPRMDGYRTCEFSGEWWEYHHALNAEPRPC